MRRFSLVLTLLNDPAFADANTKQDLETLAKGFIDLANAAAPPVKVTAAAPEPTPPPPAASKRPAAPAEMMLPRRARADGPTDADGHCMPALTRNSCSSC